MFRVALLMLQGATQSEAAAPAKRPNILFCFADDWGRYASIYATTENRPSPNQVVETPNIDRVAREGALFQERVRQRSKLHAVPKRPLKRTILLPAPVAERFCTTPCGTRAFRRFRTCCAMPVITSAKRTKSGAPARRTMRRSAAQKCLRRAGGKYNNFSENATQMVKQGKSFDEARDLMLAEVRGNF